MATPDRSIPRPFAHAPSTPTAVLLLAALGTTAAGCGGSAQAVTDPEHQAVRQVFDRFQRAVLEGDRDTFFRLVPPDLLEVAEQLDVTTLGAGRDHALEVVEVRPNGSSSWQVRVRDPEHQGGREPADDGIDATFIVIRHGGRLLVDLVATAAVTGGIDRRGRGLDHSTLEVKDTKDMPGVAVPAAYRPSAGR